MRYPGRLCSLSAWLIVAGYTSINAVVKAELFPALSIGDAPSAAPSAAPTPAPQKAK